MSTSKSRYRSDDVRRIGPNDSDPFGHRDYANAIVKALEDFPPRFTLGLFGPWGSGKSTILEEVGRQLREESPTKTAFVMFDAWRFEGDSLRRELIREVGTCLERQKALRDGFDLKEHTEVFGSDTTTTERPGLKLEWGSIQNGLVAAALAVVAAAAFLVLIPKLGASKTTTLQFLVAIAGALTTFTLVALRQVVVPEPVQKTRRRLEFPDEFAANFKTLLDNVSAERLVIAIDNLDRCSPARVTEILSSIKTFLEPALDEKSESKRTLKKLYFIVAADDAALRRHLTAQELGHSADGSSPDEGESLPEEVRSAVNEYLRKFFGASLRIQELLDEDVRAFTEEELAEFVEAHGIGKELRKELIEMTSQALKRNPRRIKQFVNNLQLRLEMLDARRTQKRVLLEVDERVVAKLAIIEEEFPSDFERLQGEPALLRTWHDEVRVAGGKSSLDPDLADFLRFTDDIQPRDIRAYLSLKQTIDELQLPRYGEFVDFLDGGDVENLQHLLADEEGDEAKYAAAACRHFQDQRRRGAWGRAHNTLRSVVEIPLLHGSEGDLFKQILRSTMREPHLEERLTQLEPGSLLEVAVRHDLPPSDMRLLIGALVSGMDPKQSSEVRRGIAEALTRFPQEVDERMRARIRRTLDSEGVRSDLDSYVSLGEALPEVLSEETLDVALGRLEESGRTNALRASSAYRIALAMLRWRHDAERLDRFLQLVRPTLDAQLGSGSEELGVLAMNLVEVLDGAGETPTVNDLSAWLSSNLDGLPPGSNRSVLPILELGFSLCRASPSADVGAGPKLASWLFDFEDGDRIVAWLSERFERLPPEFAKKTRELVVGAMAGRSASLSPAQGEKLAALHGKERQREMRREAVAAAIADGQVEAVRTLTAKLGEDERKGLIADALAAVKDSAPSHLGEAAFLVDQRSLLGGTQRFELATALTQTIYDHRDKVLTAAPLIGKIELDDPDLRRQVVEHLLQAEADMVDRENREAVLRATWSAAGNRASKARSLAQARLKEIAANDPDLGDFARELLDLD